VSESFSSSTELNELFSALSKAQSEIKAAELDGFNPHFKSKYATLTSVQDAYRDAIAKYGLCIIQQVYSIESGYFIRSVLGHSSGQWVSNVFRLIVAKNDMQGLGSAITYGRRYGICSLLGIADTEDDDGNLAVKNTQKGELNGTKQTTNGPHQRANPHGKPSGRPTDRKLPAPAAGAREGGPEGPKEPRSPEVVPANDSEPRKADEPNSEGARASNTQGRSVPNMAPGGESNPTFTERAGYVTEPQIKRLFAICKSHNWTNEQLKSFIQLFFGIDSTKDLDFREYSRLVSIIEMHSFDDAVERVVKRTEK
jgi:hypothetical protein